MMSVWSELFTPEKQPDFRDFADFVGLPLWDRMNEWIKNEYRIEPKIEYSKCPAQKGWNIKYKKGGKSLCTLYPMENYYIALVVINEKMKPQAELEINCCSEYMRELFGRTPFSCGGQWMMVQVKNEQVFEDLIRLINVRSKLG